MIDQPRHTGPGVPAPCGCLWEAGTVYPCVEHATPHSQHASIAPFCDLCDAALNEARETVEPPAEEVYGVDCAEDFYLGRPE